MLRYRTEISFLYPKIDIRQYVIYIGKTDLSMKASVVQTGLNYNYTIIDMHTIDCERLLQLDNSDALVLAVLCDFKGRPNREVIRYILQRLKQLNGANESKYREYVHMLEILSSNRDLTKTIEQEQQMLTQIEQHQLPSFRVGMRYGMEQGRLQGMEQGRLQGEGKLLERLLIRRFGAKKITKPIRQKLSNATIKELECWGDNILDSKTPEDVFR